MPVAFGILAWPKSGYGLQLYQWAAEFLPKLWLMNLHMSHSLVELVVSARIAKPMGIKVNPAEVFRHQLDSPLYKGHPSTKAIELEAFSVGANPPWAIKLLDHFCKD